MASADKKNVRLKCYLYTDEDDGKATVMLVKVPRSATQEQFSRTLNQSFQCPVQVSRFEDDDKDWITVDSNFDFDDLLDAFDRVQRRGESALKIVVKQATPPMEPAAHGARLASSTPNIPTNTKISMDSWETSDSADAVTPQSRRKDELKLEVTRRPSSAPPLRAPQDEATSPRHINISLFDDLNKRLSIGSNPTVTLETPPLRTPPRSPTPSSRTNSISSDTSLTDSISVTSDSEDGSEFRPTFLTTPPAPYLEHDSRTPPLRTPPGPRSPESSSDSEDDEANLPIRELSPAQLHRPDSPPITPSSNPPQPKIKIEELINLNQVNKTDYNSNTNYQTMSWRKGSLLGKGGFGHVYLGMNDDTGEFFAVKQLEIDMSSEDKTRKSVLAFQQEIELMRKLNHPNIVRYLGTQLQSSTMYVFLEYVSGGSISSLISKFGPFKENVIKIYTKHILQGLQYLHENNIIHRDIKGANILIDANRKAKLADFGCAKTFAKEANQSNFKSVLGTPHWMAPEVIRGEGHGRSADIWSMGCTIIEMATGRPPWAQEFPEVAAVIFHIASSNETPQIPEHLSPEAHDFLLRCFRRNPKERPDAAQLLSHAFIKSGSTNETDIVLQQPHHKEVAFRATSIHSLAMSPPTIATFHSLGSDLILRVFSFLEESNFATLALVCKSWRILMEDDMIWRYKVLQKWKQAKKTEEVSWSKLYWNQVTHDKQWIYNDLSMKILKGKTHSKSINYVTFNSTHAATCSDDKKIKIWNLNKRKLSKTLKGHDGAVHAVQFCQNDTKLVSGSSDKKIKIWDLKSRKAVATWEAHGDIVSALQCLGTRLVSASFDKTIRIWDLTSNSSTNSKPVCTLTGHKGAIHSLCFVDHTIVTASVDCTVRLFDVRMEKCTRVLEGHTAEVTCLQFDKSTNSVISGSADKTIKEWDVGTESITRTIAAAHDDWIWTLQFDANKIVSASKDKHIKIWNRNNNNSVKVLKSHTDAVHSLMYDATKMLSVGADKVVRLWLPADTKH